MMKKKLGSHSGIVFGTAWWFIYASVVLPCPLASSQYGFGWVKVSVMMWVEVSVRNSCFLNIDPVRLDFTLRNSSFTGSSSKLCRAQKTSLLYSNCYSEIESNMLEMLVF